MSTTTRTTELEAINTMLGCISESPINSLDVTGLVDVDTAKSVLNEVCRAVQEESWHWNCEEDYPILRNSDNKLSVPTNALKIVATADYLDIDVTQRGAFLYSRKNRSFVFTKDIKVNITFLLPFEDIPEPARRYIMIRAARVFQTRQQGSEAQYKFSEAEELLARASVTGAESEEASYNFLTGSRSVAEILDR